MTFAEPRLLWLLLVPVAFAAWDLARRRRERAGSHPRILRAEAGPSSVTLAPSRSGAPAGGAPRFRPWLWCGLALAAAALARPQWGRLEEPVFDQSREILLAVDLSRSMLAPDVKPSRLERSKLLIQSLLEKLAGERVGLVVFAGTSFLQVPLSADYEILREFLPNLNPGFLPEVGTNYGAMLETAVQAFGSSGAADRFLIVLSDGEATDPAWKDRIEALRKKSVRVIGLGVGTAGGGMIPESDGSFLKDERGAVVLSRLEPATLQELARATEGVYRDASAWIDVAGLVKETVDTGRRGEFVETSTVRQVERFQWPLALAFWCLLVSLYHEFPVRPKNRAITLRPNRASAGPAAAAALLLALAGATPGELVAAAKLAPTASSSPMPSAQPGAVTPPGDPAALGRIVGRLSAATRPSARDWAELAGETVTWGSRIQSQGQPVAPGPVNDALAGVSLGEKLDAKATDWTKLRSELEALLEEKDREDKKDEQKQDEKKDQKKSEEQKENQDKDQQGEQQKNDQQQDSPQQQQKQQQDKSSEKKDSAQEQPEERKPEEGSELGDMSRKDQPPPPPPENMQQVGGTPEKKPEEQQEQADPALALPLQKLDQLRNLDSPAQLFQLMEGDRKGERKTAPRTGKSW